jgi:hypothetical protein
VPDSGIFRARNKTSPWIGYALHIPPRATIKPSPGHAPSHIKRLSPLDKLKKSEGLAVSSVEQIRARIRASDQPLDGGSTRGTIPGLFHAEAKARIAKSIRDLISSVSLD